MYVLCTYTRYAYTFTHTALPNHAIMKADEYLHCLFSLPSLHTALEQLYHHTSHLSEVPGWAAETIYRKKQARRHMQQHGSIWYQTLQVYIIHNLICTNAILVNVTCVYMFVWVWVGMYTCKQTSIRTVFLECTWQQSSKKWLAPSLRYLGNSRSKKGGWQ